MRGSSRVSYASFEILTPKWDHWPKCHTRHTVHNMFCKVTSLVASKYDVLTEGRVGVDQEMPQICGQICGQRWDGVKIPNFLLMSFMKDTEMEIGKALTAFGFSLPRNHRVHIRARRNAAQVTLFPWLNFFHESTFSEPFTAVQCVPVEKAHGFVQQKLQDGMTFHPISYYTISGVYSNTTFWTLAWSFLIVQQAIIPHLKEGSLYYLLFQKSWLLYNK